MSAARTARRRRKQMSMNNAHLSGLGVSRFPGLARAAELRQNRALVLERKKERR